MKPVGCSYEYIKNNDRKIMMFTGLPNAQIFEALCGLLKNLKVTCAYNWDVVKISRTDQIFLCLMKLRQNHVHLDLADRFGISESTVSNIFITWVHILHTILAKQLMGSIPRRHKNKSVCQTVSAVSQIAG